MAYELSGYQIALISVLALNFVFWILIVVCKSFLAENISNAFRRYITGLRDLFRPHEPTIRETDRSNPGTLERQSQIINVHEPPPPYEEAVKYPSISSLLSSSTLESANYHPGICNEGLMHESIVITITSDSHANESTVVDEEGEMFFPTTSQVSFSPPVRSLSCNDLLNLPSLPFNDKSQFTVSPSPFYTKQQQHEKEQKVTCSTSANCKLKSKLPQEVNFTLKVNTNQPCTSRSTSAQANVTGISETICLRENCSLSKNTSIIDDDDAPSSTMPHVETCTSVLANTN